MVNVKINVELKNFSNLALKELQNQVALKLINIKDKIENSVKEILKLSFYNSKHYISLVSGELRVEFGLENPVPMLKTIIDALINSIKIEQIPGKGENLGGIKISAIRDDFNDALSANGASYISVSSSGNKLVPWLEWLLFAGDRVLLGDYAILRSARVQKWSRTDEAIMIRSDKLPPWRVPAKYAGTVKDNWLTEIAKDSGPKILEYLEKEIKRTFNV